jgi:hypothetical protein
MCCNAISKTTGMAKQKPSQNTRLSGRKAAPAEQRTYYYRVLLIRSPRVIDRAKKKNLPIEALGLLIGMYLYTQLHDNIRSPIGLKTPIEALELLFRVGLLIRRTR